jgi:hypothetical protein
MTYDSVYPTFRPAAQARSRLLRRSHLAAMPVVRLLAAASMAEFARGSTRPRDVPPCDAKRNFSPSLRPALQPPHQNLSKRRKLATP